MHEFSFFFWPKLEVGWLRSARSHPLNRQIRPRHAARRVIFVPCTSIFAWLGLHPGACTGGLPPIGGSPSRGARIFQKKGKKKKKMRKKETPKKKRRGFRRRELCGSLSQSFLPFTFHLFYVFSGVLRQKKRRGILFLHGFSTPCCLSLK